jgi:hypothetical protein
VNTECGAEEGTGSWSAGGVRRLGNDCHTEVLPELHHSQDTTGVNQSRKVRWKEHVARVGVDLEV